MRDQSKDGHDYMYQQIERRLSWTAYTTVSQMHGMYDQPVCLTILDITQIMCNQIYDKNTAEVEPRISEMNDS